jgi:hypothetical protein
MMSIGIVAASTAPGGIVPAVAKWILDRVVMWSRAR